MKALIPTTVGAALVAGPLILLTACETTSDQTQLLPNPALQTTMQAKMGPVSELLRGISLQDFPRIESSAATLTALSEASDWQVHATVEYGIFSEQFRQNTGHIAQHARNRDITAVRAEYVRMIETCFRCHAYLRREGLLDDPTISRARPEPTTVLGAAWPD